MMEEVKRNTGLELIEYLSGGNHELFHSNLLAFIAKNFPDFFKSIFNLRNFDYKPENVKREENKFDLSISDGKEYILVIENKMKSLPDLQQLDRYTQKLEKKGHKDCKKILLSLIDTVKDTGNKGWELMTYQQLAENMRKGLNDKLADPSYLNQFLNDYIDYIRDLYSNIENLKSKLDSDTTFQIFKEKEKGWLQLFNKKVIFELIGRKIKEGIGYKDYCRVDAGIVMGRPFVEASIAFKDGKIKKLGDRKSEFQFDKYWIVIYPLEIQHVFSVVHDIKKPLKKDKKEREEIIERVWSEYCQNKSYFKEIAFRNFKDQYFDKENFIPRRPGKNPLRAYLYDSLAMLIYSENLYEETKISSVVADVVNNMKTVIDKFEKEEF